jgi:hypothetical protein
LLELLVHWEEVCLNIDSCPGNICPGTACREDRYSGSKMS